MWGWGSSSDEIREGKFKGAKHRLPDETNVFDVVIAGAGPAGATCAYYLSKFSRGLYAGTPLRVALLEKATFPRDKYCGDAWCAPALDILEDMGVLQDLEKEGLVCNCLCGGFVSPAGHSFIANDRDTHASEKNMATRCYAIKRMIADERIAKRAAEQPGVQLFENARVDSTVLDHDSGIWTIKCGDGRSFNSRMLVAADGAASQIGRSLGLVQDPPQGVAARRYIKPGTHNFKGDGVLLYPDYTLPGYVALFRHFDNSIDLGLYLLPGGAAKGGDLQEIYEKKLMTDPFVSRALGSKVEFSERLKVASLRLGGEKCSYGEHIVLVGDAAGQVDPLTGEGIHTGQIGGKIAAQVISEMFRKGNFSTQASKVYHSRWWREFGKDFPMSNLAGKLVFRAPFLMDAVPKASSAKGGKEGSAFFADFGAVMTGVLPKTTLILPSVAIPLATETMKQFFSQHIMCNERNYYTDPSILLDSELKRMTSWDAQCLIDPTEPVASKPKEESTDGGANEVFQFAKESGPPRVLVLYGSEYGFSRELANNLCLQLSSEDVASPRCLSLRHHDIIDWEKEKAIFIVCSTAGDGEPPCDARPFFEVLADGSTNHDLNHLKFALLAPGDHAYPKFAQAGKDLQRLLKLCGCTELMDLETIESDSAADALPWINSCTEYLRTKPFPSTDAGFAEEEDYLRERVRENLHLFEAASGATRENPVLATLSNKVELTRRDNDSDDKETWHIVLDTSSTDGMLTYQPGDAVGVMPQNNPSLVKEILTTAGILPETLVDGRSVWDILLASDLKDSHVNLKLDPNEHFIDIVERVVRQANPEVLNLIRTLKALAPRYYSIASSPSKDRGSIHICVAAVRYKTLGKVRQGVASTYLIDRVKNGDAIRVWIQRNSAFRPSPKSIMIGPGTGLAPFRSFIRETNFTSGTLFFGCRHEAKDFLYKEEILDWGSTDLAVNQLYLAFSRDSDSKVYVQHRLLDPAVKGKVWSLLSDTSEPAHVYICGEGHHMANDVKSALFQIISENIPAGSSPEQFLRGRLHLDVWVS